MAFSTGRRDTSREELTNHPGRTPTRLNRVAKATFATFNVVKATFATRRRVAPATYEGGCQRGSIGIT